MSALAKRIASLERRPGGRDGPAQAFVIKSNGRPTCEQLATFIRDQGHDFDPVRNPVIILTTFHEDRDGNIEPVPLRMELMHSYKAKR